LKPSNIYELIKLQTCSGQPLETTTAGNTHTDAFGRSCIATPFTLFDSSHRYQDNGLWATATGASSDATFDADQGLVELNVPTTSGGYVTRETKEVFSYQ